MAKVYSSKRDAKELARTAKPGDVFYTINEHRVTHPGAAARTYSEHRVGRGRGFASGGAMLEGPGHTSLEQLVYSSGPVYSEKPRGMRNITDPAPQVNGPLGFDSERTRGLSRSEIEKLEHEANEARRNWL